MKKNSHKKNIKKSNLECRMAFRVTVKEKEEIVAKAQQCAMSQSTYIRRCVVGHKPKLHLTERETEAFISLANARGDIIHISSVASGQMPRANSSTSTIWCWLQTRCSPILVRTDSTTSLVSVLKLSQRPRWC